MVVNACSSLRDVSIEETKIGESDDYTLHVMLDDRGRGISVPANLTLQHVTLFDKESPPTKRKNSDYSSSDTSCVCHHNPSDYPYHICNSLYTRDGAGHSGSPQKRKNSISDDTGHQNQFSFNGILVSRSLATYFVVGLLIGMILLTAAMLLVGSRKRKKRREDNLRHQQNAHEALLMQQANDNRYQPSA
ncbi:hypothetical protein KIN20_018571 [Parelaphostrongylus tenuis]|uniref:Uncharacterized protein n=1 Tax=Parelaphostrongylus tenuis TaxID=148309 RepID=A0AAD5QUF1_PARTN|nr:hypothetical protein KIN20_018571 [Parelaphostrongylus tenuis]